MRKLVALTLSLMLLLSFAGCGNEKTEKKEEKKTVNTENLTVITRGDVMQNLQKNEGSAPAEKRGINNFLYKLSSEKKATIGYFGGSVTHGYGVNNSEKRWSTITHRHLESKFPDCTLTEHNGSWGGTGSEYGMFRAKEELLSVKPDLVFIEFAINDAYHKSTKEQSGYTLEGLIRNVQNNSPYTDIVLVFITDMGNKGGISKQLEGHLEIAEHYGIPYVMAGEYLAKVVGENGKWEDYLADWAHPTDLGYKVYGDAVIEAMDKFIAGSKAEKVKYKLPTSYYKNAVEDADVLFLEDMKYTEEGFVVRPRTGSIRSGYALTSKAGSYLETEFEGSILGLCLRGAKSRPCTEMQFIVDGKYVASYNFALGENDIGQNILFDNLSEGKHTLRIVNKSGGRGELIHLSVASREFKKK